MELRHAGAFDGEAKRNEEISSKEAGHKVDNKESACKKSDHEEEVSLLLTRDSPLASLRAGFFFFSGMSSHAVKLDNTLRMAVV